MSEAVLILGASSAIARAIASRLAQEKYHLYLAGRDVDELNLTAADLRLRFGVNATAFRFDATDFASHRPMFEQCLAGGDTLAGVVLAQGYMAPQGDAQKDFELARRTVDTNYTASVSILELAAAHFEQRRSGFICAISSVAGDRGRQSNYIYGSAKAALTTYLAGLRHRLTPAGVPVITVKPGFVDTSMTWGLPGLFLIASPEKVAADICRAIHNGKSEIYTPWFWRWIMLIIKSVPEPIFRKTKL